jgi:hypothetical protein
MRRLVLTTLSAALTVVLAAPLVGTAPATADDSSSTPRLASQRQIALATPGDFTGYGFDQCLAPKQSAMDTW